jgi:hypothetical protein
MSLNIDVDKVEAVLLSDGWHLVLDASFTLDAYEYTWQGSDDLVYASRYGRECTGFSFKEKTANGIVLISGPMESLLAVREASGK